MMAQSGMIRATKGIDSEDSAAKIFVPSYATRLFITQLIILFMNSSMHY